MLGVFTLMKSLPSRYSKVSHSTLC